ncbi:MAG TPA: phosphatase PAP2 family protein [Anaerolineales bacterium]|nr:phosphatase PAP2 family protein [Anaerolineales bacterium]
MNLQLSRSNRRLILLGFTVVSLVVATWLAFGAYRTPVWQVDVDFTVRFQEGRSDLLDQLMPFVSLFGYQPWNVILVLAGGALAAALFNWRVGLFYIGAVLFQASINVVLKWLVARPRPLPELVWIYQDSGFYSFPSGHVMFYTVAFGLIVILALRSHLWMWLRYLLAGISVAMVILVGPSRIYLGAHWLSDIIAAYIVGIVCLVWSIDLFSAWRRRGKL